MITADSDGGWLGLPAHDTDEKLGPATCFHDTNELGRGGLCRLCGGAYLWDCRKDQQPTLWQPLPTPPHGVTE